MLPSDDHRPFWAALLPEHDLAAGQEQLLPSSALATACPTTPMASSAGTPRNPAPRPRRTPVMPPDDHDLYAVLGVAPDASPAQIGHAYRLLLRAHHPDIHPNPDSAALAAAMAAATILRDPARRAAYDRTRRPTRDQPTAPPQPTPRPHRTVPDIRVGPVRWHPH